MGWKSNNRKQGKKTISHSITVCKSLSTRWIDWIMLVNWIYEKGILLAQTHYGKSGRKSEH